MNRIWSYSILFLLLIAAAAFSAGCMSEKGAWAPSPADELAARAAAEYTASNYQAAAELFTQAYSDYQARGDTVSARKAMRDPLVAQRMILEFPFNRSAAESEIRKEYPELSAREVADLLSEEKSIRIRSDGEYRYFSDTVSNIRFHNLTLIRRMIKKSNHSPFFDDTRSLAFAPPPRNQGPYGDPVVFDMIQRFSLPAELLPKAGTMRVWVPAPIESGSQSDVAILSIEPAQYIRSWPDTSADIGLAYLEIPLADVKGDQLNITTRFRFTQHEVRFVIDPSRVKAYNTSDPEYLHYTASGKNIAVTPGINKKAIEIVGNETNPYLQAKKIYWHIMDTLPYSHVPHLMLETAGIPESTYVLETGFGDCGAQSMYFAALCRALGIPSRATGGFQLVPGLEGTHFWAEYYLEGYGWIPVDVTIAEAADWSHDATSEERHRYKEYYFGSLDPYRYIIQKDVDVPITPNPGDAVMFRLAVQNPKIACDTCTEDMEILLADHWTMNVTQV